MTIFCLENKIPEKDILFLSETNSVYDSNKNTLALILIGYQSFKHIDKA